MTKAIAAFSPGTSTRVRRKDRSVVEEGAAERVIDESLVAHVAFNTPDGVAQCLPMAFGRRGATIYLHGAVANAHLNTLTGCRCSLTFTLLDGFVFARSAYHHSMNYRCAVVLGAARAVTSEEEKRLALQTVLEHAAPGRSNECVGMTDAEVRGTCVIAVDVEQAAVKRRTGPPVDEAPDVEEGSRFAGVVQLQLKATELVRDPALSRAVALPPSVGHFFERFGKPFVVQTAWRDWTLSSDPSRVDRAWLHRVLSEESYWAKGVSGQALDSCLDASLLFGVYDGKRQVGFARVFSDVSRLAYLADVFISSECRGVGLGTRLVQFVLAHPAVARCERVLLGTRDAAPFYEKFGFLRADNVYLVQHQATRDDRE